MTAEETKQVLAGVDDAKDEEGRSSMPMVVWRSAFVSASVYLLISVFAARYNLYNTQYSWRVTECGSSPSQWACREPDRVFDLWLPAVGSTIVVVILAFVAIVMFAGIVAFAARQTSDTGAFAFGLAIEVLLVISAIALAISQSTGHTIL